MKLKFNKNQIFYLLLGIMLAIILGLLLTLYLRYVDRETNKILEKTDKVYTAQKMHEIYNGFIEVDIKNELKEYLKENDFETVTFMLNKEDFFFEISTYEEKDEVKFALSKIVHNRHNINAKMNLRGIEKIEYQTGNTNNATVLNLITENDSEYLAIIKDTYYFLGNNIESISFKNGNFYSLTYNSKYRILDNAVLCTDEIKKEIEKFKMSDYYYKYGKINFLEDYYQKPESIKTFTVENRCAELEAKNGSEKIE